VLIQRESLAKMLRLLGIVGGRVVEQEQHADFVRMLIEKGFAEDLS
jgi:hypothetical protein